MSAGAPPTIPLSASSSPPATRLWLFRWLAAVSIPVVLLFGLEGTLRLAGFGRSASFLIPDDQPGYYRSNPEYVSLFMPGSFDLRLLNFRVAAHKPANMARIVVLGESAARGIPAPAFGFAPQLRAQLRPRKQTKVKHRRPSNESARPRKILNISGRSVVSRGMNRLLLLLAVCVAVPAAWADHRDEDRRERGPRVIFFQHADYQGEALVLYPGDALDNLANAQFENGARLNDSISSIRVEGGAEVYVYEASRFRGQVLRLTESARDLTGRLMPGSVSASWNDRISSIRVERGPERRVEPGRDRRRDTNEAPRIDPDVMIDRAYLDLLLRKPDDYGRRQYRERVLDQGWTESMVRDHLRRSDEFRREGAERIVRRAYRDVLGRDADPSGLKQYCWALTDKDWTESDVRDDLRRSAEFRNKSGRR